MKHLCKFLTFWCLLALGAANAQAQGFKSASGGWACEGSTPFTNTTFYYDGITPTTNVLSLVQNVGDGFNIVSSSSCAGHTFYCATSSTELVRAVVTNHNEATFSATTPHWIKGTVVLPNSKVYITVDGSTRLEMYRIGNVYSADINFGTTGKAFTISGDLPSATTIRGENGLGTNLAASGLPLTGGALNRASVQLNLTGLASQYTVATVSFNLATNQVTQSAITCFAPSNLNVSNVTSTTATLGWTANGSETVWNIEYGLSGFTPGTGTTVSAAANSYTLTNLSSALDYQFYVQANCGGANGTSSWAGPYNFNTSCVITTFPYSNNFNSTIAFPTCFDYKTANSATVTWKASGFNNTPCIEMNAGMGGDCYLVLPQTQALINTLQLNFNFEDGNSSTLKIGYFDAALTTFTETSTIYVPANLQNITADFVGITGLTGTERMAIKYIGAANWFSGRFDDLIISQITCYKPVNLSATAISETAATFNWAAGGSETSWNVEYGPKGFAHGTGTTETVTTTTYNLTGLQMGTDYQFYVRSNCSANDVSLWAGPYNFTTLCGAISTFPYTQNFNNVTSFPNCFNTQTTGTANFSWYQNALNGIRCLEINNINSSGGYVILPVTQPLLNTLELSFSSMVIKYQYSGYKIGYFDQNLTVFTPLASINNSSEFQNFKVSLNNGNTLTGNERIAIKFEATQTSVYFYIDDITLTQPSCLVPYNLSASDLTANSATLGWAAGGSETSWNVEYGYKGFTRGKGTTVTTTTNSYQLNGLTWGTEYDFYVRANCSSSDTSMWSTPYTFATPCQTISSLPYFNNFNHLVSMPLCFDTKTGNNANVEISFDNETHCLRMNTGLWQDCYLILPQTQDLINTLNLRFRVKSGFGTLRFGYFDAGLNTFTEVSNHPIGGKKIINTSLTTANALTGTERIAIKLEMEAGYDYGILDDLYIYNASSCIPPYSFAVQNVTGNSATLGWTAGNSETAWNIEYGPKGFTQGTGTVVAAGTNSLTITGLNQGTEYEFYVQSNCGAGNTSNWSEKSSFCTSYNFPFTESFTNGYLPSVWENIKPKKWEYTSSGNNPVCTPNNPGMITFQNNEVFNKAILRSPKIDLTDKSAEVKIKLYRSTLYGNDSVKVYISKDNAIGANSVLLGTVHCKTNRLDGFYEFTFAVPDTFNTADNYIFIEGKATTRNNIYIDDISVVEKLQNDARIDEVLNVPSINLNLTQTITPSAVIKNSGTNILTSANVSYSLIKESNIIFTNTVNWTGTLGYNQTDTLMLPAIEIPNADTSSYVLSVQTLLPNDQNTSNDTAKVTFKTYRIGNLIYDNGPVANDTLADGTIVSVIQSSIGLGFSGVYSGVYIEGEFRLADEFTVPEGQQWNIDGFATFIFQTYADTLIYIQSQNIKIWRGNPMNGGSIIYDFSKRNALLSSEFTSVYRVAEDNLSDKNRAIMRNFGDVKGVTLPAGTYWLDWNVTPASSYDAYNPLITISGQSITGNALQTMEEGWTTVTSGTRPQGLPFQLFGNKRDLAKQTAVLPDSSAVDVAFNAPVQIKFNSSISSIDANKIHIITANSDTLSNVTATINAGDNSIIDIAHNSFNANTTYRVVVEENALVTTLYNEAFEWSFTTGVETGVNNIDKSNITVYPNPTTSKLTVNFGSLNVSSIIITDIAGKVLKNEKLNGTSEKYETDLSNYNKGIYFIQIVTDEKVYTEKIIKL